MLSPRLDCHFHHQRERRWYLFGVHLFRLLRRPDTWTSRLPLAQQENRRMARHLSLHNYRHRVCTLNLFFQYFFISNSFCSLEFTIWFVPSLIQNAVAVSVVGVLLGPMYPIAVNQAARILPRWILTGAVGWIAGFGQAGSALLPFMVGTIASKYGIACLQPLYVC